MKADQIGIKFHCVFSNIRENDASEKRYSPMVIHDEHRIQQVLLNLQSNALKFTSKGEVKIQVAIIDKLEGEDKIEKDSSQSECESDDVINPEDQLYLKISVIDTGSGIKHSEQNKLF